jgi:hypothetical protein
LAFEVSLPSQDGEALLSEQAKEAKGLASEPLLGCESSATVLRNQGSMATFLPLVPHRTTFNLMPRLAERPSIGRESKWFTIFTVPQKEPWVLKHFDLYHGQVESFFQLLKPIAYGRIDRGPRSAAL